MNPDGGTTRPRLPVFHRTLSPSPEENLSDMSKNFPIISQMINLLDKNLSFTFAI